MDELALTAFVLNQWTDFELSQFIVPITCPKSVLSAHDLFLSSRPSQSYPPRCSKPNLFELLDYNRSKIIICTHGCECAWCRDCSRRVNIETPHDCEDAALEDLAGERRWMRCPRPSTSCPGIAMRSCFLGLMLERRLQSYGGEECRLRSYHLQVWDVSRSVKVFCTRRSLC